MKKTYNVTSQKFSSVFTLMMFFAFFFLGMNSTDAQVLSTSRVEADKAANVDFGITAKADITLDDATVIQILKQENKEVLENQPTSAVEEAEMSARGVFLTTAMEHLQEGTEVRQSLTKAQAAMAVQIGKFNDATKTLIDADGIVREYVARLK